MKQPEIIKNTEHVIKKVKNLEFGDVVYINAPFKENTNEFYNGYNVEDVLGSKYKNRFGQSSKKRPVMVISNENNEIHYAPLTSKHNALPHHPDTKNHYKCTTEVKANDKHPKYYTSYIELDTISTFKFNNENQTISSQSLNDFDKGIIQREFTKRSRDYSEKEDTKRFIQDFRKPKLINHLKHTGFEEENQNESIKFKKDNMEINIDKNGIITYHHIRTLDEVLELHNPLIKYMQKTNTKQTTIERS